MIARRQPPVKQNPQSFLHPRKIAENRRKTQKRCKFNLQMGCRLDRQNDLEWLPLLPGCGTQHPHRALGGTRVLLAAAPTTPPCFRRWRRSSSLHFGHQEWKEYFVLQFRNACGRFGTVFLWERLRWKASQAHIRLQPFFASQKGAQGLFWAFSGRFDAFQGPFTQNCSTFAAVRGILQAQSSALFNMPFP